MRCCAEPSGNNTKTFSLPGSCRRGRSSSGLNIAIEIATARRFRSAGALHVRAHIRPYACELDALGSTTRLVRTPARACQLAHEGCRRRVVDRALGTPENPPPLPRSCPQHRSEHPDSLERCDRPLRRPTNHAELLHPATAAGHSRLREASNRPKHARFAGVVSGEARSAAAGRGRWLAQKPQGPPFFPSRALGPVLMPSARGRWPFFVRPAPQMANQIAPKVSPALASRQSLCFRGERQYRSTMVQILSVGGRAAVGTDACWLKGEGTEIIMNQSNAPGSIP